MSQIRFPSASAQQIRWPNHSAGILALGQAVLAAEQALSPAQQYPQLALLPPRMEALVSFATTAGIAEADRTAQADAEKTAFETARTLTRRLTIVLLAKYVNLALLEAWGVEVVGSGTHIRLRAPHKREAVLQMLNRYIAKENSLPADQRITSPTLAQVTAIREDLATAYAQRVGAIATRELAIRQRNEASQALLQTLKLIAFHHITFDFGGVVDQNLQTLGFDLVTRTHPGGNTEPNPTP